MTIIDRCEVGVKSDSGRFLFEIGSGCQFDGSIIVSNHSWPARCFWPQIRHRVRPHGRTRGGTHRLEWMLNPWSICVFFYGML